MRKMGFTFLFEVLVIFIASCIVLSFWTDRTLDFWVSRFEGVAVDVPAWISVLVTLITNFIMLALNIISEIVRLFI